MDDSARRMPASIGHDAMGGECSPATFFAPAGRSTLEELRRSYQRLKASLSLQAALDAMPVAVAVLDQHRQIVLANQRLLSLLGSSEEGLLGKRPGEALDCVHWRSGPDGCGTSRACTFCGTVNAILETQTAGVQHDRECRLRRQPALSPEVFDLHVTTTEIAIDDERFTVCAIQDQQVQKRFQVLTRAFYHDVLNTAGGIRGFADFLLRRASAVDAEQSHLNMIVGMAEQLVEEIRSQRDLTEAESGDLRPEFDAVAPCELVERVVSLYSKHASAEQRSIVTRKAWQGVMVTDYRLLSRVLGNMLKNALEATPPGGAVHVDCQCEDDQVTFSVHNAAVMNEEVRSQVFQRSFSTKAPTGRGIGTYSIKLLGERYLGGVVDFVSQAPEGTVFRIRLPRKPRGPAA